MTDQHRNVCFTSFIENLDELLDPSEFKYIVMQQEICPETKRIHWQGYAEFSAPYRLKRIKRCLRDEAAHVEPRHGTAEQAAAYCKPGFIKDGVPKAVTGKCFEHGRISRPGARSDVHEMVTMIKEGKSNVDLIEELPDTFARYYKAADRIRLELGAAKARGWRSLECVILYGDSGVGKTRSVYESFPPEDIFKLNVANNLWFDGYSGQSVLLLDDFYGWIKFGIWLELTDGYPYRCEIKGGFV